MRLEDVAHPCHAERVGNQVLRISTSHHGVLGKHPRWVQVIGLEDMGKGLEEPFRAPSAENETIHSVPRP